MKNAILRKEILKLYASNSIKREDLSDDFFRGLIEFGERQNINPRDLLLVMYIESGVNPNAGASKSGHAVGLTQVMPVFLKNLGWRGSSLEYSNLSAEQQLPWIEKFYTSIKPMIGKSPIETAARLYQANYLPGTLKKGTGPEIELAFKGHPYYDQNPGLDFNKDGIITVGDLENFVNKKSQETGYLSLVKRLDDVENSLNEEDNIEEENDEEESIPQTLNKVLEQAQHALGTDNNYFLICLNSNDLTSSIEFARILRTALYEELKIKSFTHSDNKTIEIECCADSSLFYRPVKLMCSIINDKFARATNKIGSINVNSVIIKNTKSNLKPISLKLADRSFRRFRLRFLDK